MPYGTYTVNLTGNTDGNYTPSTDTSHIVVNKIPSSVVATADDIHLDENAIIDIDIGVEDAEGSVNVTVNGKLYPNIHVSKGTAQVIVSDLPVGSYTVDVTYSGDDKYLPSEGSTTFEVEKLNQTISIDDSTLGIDGEITVIIPEDATGTVTIEIDGKRYTQPVVNGKAVFNLTGLKAGLYEIKVYYSGDEKYNPANTTDTVEVLSTGNNSKNDSNSDKIEHLTGLSVHETANPIMALLVVLIALGFSQLRRFWR